MSLFTKINKWVDRPFQRQNIQLHSSFYHYNGIMQHWFITKSLTSQDTSEVSQSQKRPCLTWLILSNLMRSEPDVAWPHAKHHTSRLFQFPWEKKQWNNFPKALEIQTVSKMSHFCLQTLLIEASSDGNAHLTDLQKNMFLLKETAKFPKILWA